MSKFKGVTLLEVMLVLAIAAAIILMSLQQYTLYRRDADIGQVQYNVNLLFQSMAKYFRAHCKDPPFNAYSPIQSQGVPVSTLRQDQFLTDLLPLSPIVAGDSPDEGYVTQFNQVQFANQTPALPQRMIELSSPAGKQTSMGNIVIWRAQVSVALRDQETAQQFESLLAADCLSQAASSGANPTVTQCAEAPGGATQYAVWERLPSFGSVRLNSTYWGTMPVVRQFTQMYTTYPILVLTDGTKTNVQYFVCGS